MAAVQKRIVHKQFNSPIAIYSNNNIQQVLDRELKQLSNGSVGIDFKNDPNTIVPQSLAKSAVLRALEDEEREKKAIADRRNSRPRTRTIDRETVLRINRRPRHRSADYIWPPRNQVTCNSQPFHAPPRSGNKKPYHPTAASSGNCSKVHVDDDGKMSSNAERRNNISKSIDNISNIVAAAAAVASTNISEELRSCSVSPCSSVVHLWPPPPPPLIAAIESRKTFYLPEEKLHAGDVDEIKRHFEGDNFNIKPPMASTPPPPPLPPPRNSSKNPDFLAKYKLPQEQKVLPESPTTSEYGRMFESIMAGTTVNFSDLESMFSWNEETENSRTQYSRHTEGATKTSTTSAASNLIIDNNCCNFGHEIPIELPRNFNEDTTNNKNNLMKFSSNLFSNKGHDDNNETKHWTSTITTVVDKAVDNNNCCVGAEVSSSSGKYGKLDAVNQPILDHYSTATTVASTASAHVDGVNFSTFDANFAADHANYRQLDEYNLKQLDMGNENKGLKRVAWPPPPQNDDYKVVKQPQFPPKPSSTTFHHQVGANTEQTPQAEQPTVVAAAVPFEVSVAAPPAVDTNVAQPTCTVAFSGGLPKTRPVTAPLTPLASPALSAGGGSFVSSPSSASTSTLSPGTFKGWKPVKPPVQNATTPSFAAPAFESTPAPFVSAPIEPQQPATIHPQSPVSYEHSSQYDQPQATTGFQTAAAPTPVPQSTPGLIMTSTTKMQPPQQQYQDALNQQQPSQQQQQQRQGTPAGQYPGLITQLRKEAPITQKPSPVFASQPAAAIIRGGSNMRGDEKWPPADYKVQAAEENELRRQLALGPVFRPRRVAKDYSSFFAKNALNSMFTAYRAPPGTQHIGESTPF